MVQRLEDRGETRSLNYVNEGAKRERKPRKAATQRLETKDEYICDPEMALMARI